MSDESESCAGRCKHAKKYHVVNVIGDPGKGCCMMDCGCCCFVAPTKVFSSKDVVVLTEDDVVE